MLALVDVSLLVGLSDSHHVELVLFISSVNERNAIKIYFVYKMCAACIALK